jgi:hypothetical protein
MTSFPVSNDPLAADTDVPPLWTITNGVKLSNGAC